MQEIQALLTATSIDEMIRMLNALGARRRQYPWSWDFGVNGGRPLSVSILVRSDAEVQRHELEESLVDALMDWSGEGVRDLMRHVETAAGCDAADASTLVYERAVMLLTIRGALAEATAKVRVLLSHVVADSDGWIWTETGNWSAASLRAHPELLEHHALGGAA
jgi:hypothetical protein